jgi:Tol biopolymer transport system component
VYRSSRLLAGIAILGELAAEGERGRTVLRQELTQAQPGRFAGAVSADGRHVAFVSSARLLPEDTNVVDDIYVLDRASHRLTLASVGYLGTRGNGTSLNPQLNADGRHVAFDSSGTLLTAAPDRNEADDVFVHDSATGVTTRVSVGPDGQEANGRSGRPAISADGRWIAFESAATNLVSGADANGTALDVYLRDLSTGAVTRISVDEAGRQFAHAYSPRLSGNGRLVAFAASAVRSDPSVYVRDVIAGTTFCVSCDGFGGAARLAAFAPDLSADGNAVAFAVQSTPTRSEVAVYDRASHTTTVITLRANARSTSPRLSGDGRVIAFESWASNLLCSGRCRNEDIDENLLPDVYLFERTTGRFQRASGAQATWWTPSLGPGIDGTGATVVFSSREPFGPEDLTTDFDLFVCSPVCS